MSNSSAVENENLHIDLSVGPVGYGFETKWQPNRLTSSTSVWLGQPEARWRVNLLLLLANQDSELSTRDLEEIFEYSLYVV